MVTSAQLPRGDEPPGYRAWSSFSFSKVRSQALLEGDVAPHAAHAGIHCHRTSLRPTTIQKKASNIRLNSDSESSITKYGQVCKSRDGNRRIQL